MCIRDSRSIVRCKTRFDILNRLDVDHKCDRRTDGPLLAVVRSTGPRKKWEMIGCTESNRIGHWIESNQIVFFSGKSPITTHYRWQSKNNSLQFLCHPYCNDCFMGTNWAVAPTVSVQPTKQRRLWRKCQSVISPLNIKSRTVALLMLLHNSISKTSY